MADKTFHFELSLSVLNHLGRNLYRNFITILGEAISNCWDADAKNIHISIDRGKNLLIVRDDGAGMTSDQFQNQFLRIGYSKRKAFGKTSPLNRPFIGAKGVGKLALLSCSKQVTVISKTLKADIVGGVIDNNKLDQAITNQIHPESYNLGRVDIDQYDIDITNFETGTIIIFDGLHTNIRNTLAHIRKQIAMHFRFSLIDKEFKIFVEGEEINFSDLKAIYEKTQFLWTLNEWDDETYEHFTNLKKQNNLISELNLGGFVASVEKPSHLKFQNSDNDMKDRNRMSVDLFVNGRLRQINILLEIPTSRLVENYLYGQIFYDEIENGDEDPFTTNREGVLSDNENYSKLINEVQSNLLPKIIDQWDKYRLELNQDGDEENPRKTKKQRKARSLADTTAKEFETREDHPEINKWLEHLSTQGEFYIAAYSDCFFSENLVRNYIRHKSLDTSIAEAEYSKRRTEASRAKDAANIHHIIRSDEDIDYLNMKSLALVVEGIEPKKHITSKSSLHRDAITYKPVRDAIAHTNILTEHGRNILTATYENIKARINNLLRAV